MGTGTAGEGVGNVVTAWRWAGVWSRKSSISSHLEQMSEETANRPRKLREQKWAGKSAWGTRVRPEAAEKPSKGHKARREPEEGSEGEGGNTVPAFPGHQRNEDGIRTGGTPRW